MVELIFENHIQTLWKSRPSHPLREQAWERFCALGLPKKKGSSFQHVPLQALYRSSLTQVEPQVEPKVPAQVLSLEEAYVTYGAYLKGRWSKLLKGEKDPFAALNGALYGQGHFLYIPAKQKIELPIHLLSSRLHVVVGAHSEVALKIAHQPGQWISSYVDIHLEAGARCHLETHHNDLKETIAFDHLRVTVSKGGYFKALHLTDGSACVRRDVHVQLLGEGAETSLLGAYELKGVAQAHHHICVEHVAPHCRSMQLFKGVLHEASRSSFEGKIYVHPEAQKTDAYQMNKNLLFSDRAIACSKPNLEILADDVKASHGSTTGQLAEEELFYLRSRGLDEAQARSLLIEAFLKEVTEQCSI
ncbi:MAG: Fe-S cluster assembly protein SufD [Verrucomicrobia bacterium]|nr:Fe-S cluster assembly protein SufD [Verrucomicrobiota bacterium]